jgi:hypothetical protein
VQALFYWSTTKNNAMHKPTPSRVKSKLESVSTPPMCFSREKRTFDHNGVRFGLSNRKVPATYFPLLSSVPAISPRKSAHCFGQVESTFIPKKIREWKVFLVSPGVPDGLKSPVRDLSLLVIGTWSFPLMSTDAQYALRQSFTLHYSTFTICFLSTTCGDIQQKNRQPIFSGVETSMKMTFHSFEQNRSQTRERCGSLSNTPLLFFH